LLALAFGLGVLVGFYLLRILLAELANGIAHSSLLADLSTPSFTS
jgi:hypothetical protein